MIRKLLPLLLAIMGLGAGVGAGLVLRPASEGAAEATLSDQTAEDHAAGGSVAPATPAKAVAQEGAAFDYARLNNQFVVPVLVDGQVTGLVVLTLSIEVTGGNTETIYSREPKLRDGFLVVLFDHAAAGGFDGDFTAPTKMAALRRALTEQARRILGPIANDVLIQDIIRQDS